MVSPKPTAARPSRQTIDIVGLLESHGVPKEIVDDVIANYLAKDLAEFTIVELRMELIRAAELQSEMQGRLDAWSAHANRQIGEVQSTFDTLRATVDERIQRAGKNAGVGGLIVGALAGALLAAAVIALFS